MPFTAFTALTTNTQTAAIPVIPGNKYGFDLSGTFGSSTITMQQTVDNTNYRDDKRFTSMTVAGIQDFTAIGNAVKFTCAGGTAQSLNGKLVDLGGPQSTLRPDFSTVNVQTTRTNS